MIDHETYLVELDKLRFPMINYHQKVNFGLSVVNLFGLAMGLYMFAAPLMGWIDYESPTLGLHICLGKFINIL